MGGGGEAGPALQFQVPVLKNYTEHPINIFDRPGVGRTQMHAYPPAGSVLRLAEKNAEALAPDTPAPGVEVPVATAPAYGGLVLEKTRVTKSTVEGEPDKEIKTSEPWEGEVEGVIVTILVAQYMVAETAKGSSLYKNIFTPNMSAGSAVRNESGTLVGACGLYRHL